MKHRLIPLLLLCIQSLLHADDPSPASDETFISESLAIPVFTPPPLFVPKKPLPDAVSTIVCRDDDGKPVTLQRGGPSMAPDLPVPQPVLDPPTRHFLQGARPRMRFIKMSGTVYDHKVTTVRWLHPVTQEPYEAVLGLDLGLVANLGSFVRQGVSYRSQIFCINLDTESPAAKKAFSRGRPPIIAPSIGLDAYQITQGNPEDETGIEPLLAVRDIYLAEKPRLQTLRADLKHHQKEAKKWADAHPAPVEPKVFWFKPHRNSRYLSPEDKAQQHANPATKGQVP